ncbi:phosphate ABC transporter membrane protein 2, PhoT family [Desulfacinum hydrothermale DSM 13146]|uniref:Phosphate ABC transporter membrane protein 2, PhoT family n=1 Tax=Desulfacinum hydrothermale DSM 13146 TaxID=1121390 RepID=A0A1W1XF80_9BACT|nr:ABC transporter permease subunit [Desulfacinum hydrothermale]SMC22589.1 phosphate ABC transporter membrane protein 2, PhoT family [Desulfacinum hydrothermale DSM 13146]
MKRIWPWAVRCGCYAAGLWIVSGAAGVVGFVAWRGLPHLNAQLLFGDVSARDALFGGVPVFDGLWPAVLGTVALVTGAVALAAPLGLATGIYLAEFSRGRLKEVLTVFFDVLAGIPSVVVGLFGFSVSLLLHKLVSPRLGPCLLVAAFSLMILVLPYVIRATQSALEEVPQEVRLTALSLGADRVQNLVWVLLPHSLQGIASGLLLAVGRCAEDTAVILLTGVVVTAGVPRSVLDPFEALPFYIYYISTQYGSTEELERGFAAALILLGVSVSLFALAYAVRRAVGSWALYRA